MKHFFRFCLSSLVIATLVSCSDDTVTPAVAAATDDDTEITSSTSFPVGFAVSSVFTATGSSSSKRSIGPREVIDTESTFEEKQEAIAEVIAAEDDEACEVTLPTITSGNSPSCYGPSVDFVNHPDASDSNSDTNLSIESTSGMNPGYDDYQFPSGDLGLWTSTETIDGAATACTAAKMNQLINGAASNIDSALLTVASMSCVMTRNDVDLPDSGESEDLTEFVSAALEENNDGLSVTSASVERLTDIDDNAVYLYTIVTTTDSTPSESYTTYMKYSPTNESGSTYVGKIYGLVEGVFTNGYAYSMLFDKSADELSYEMTSGQYNITDDTTPDRDDLLTTAGNIVISEMSGDLQHTIVNLDPDTNLGSTSFAWIAGGTQEETRVFNAFTQDNNGTIEGCGFFGYGEQFNSTDNEPSDNAIEQFICNWAGPNNSHNGDENMAQKQCMTKNSTTGVFEVDSDNITYAPTLSCDYVSTASHTNTVSGDSFNYTVATSTGPVDASTFTDFSSATALGNVTNDLVDISSDTDYADYTAPTAPTDPF